MESSIILISIHEYIIIIIIVHKYTLIFIYYQVQCNLQPTSFMTTPNFLSTGSVIGNLQNVPLKTCAIQCTRLEKCRGFSYDETALSCRLGSAIIHQDAEFATVATGCLSNVYIKGKLTTNAVLWTFTERRGRSFTPYFT